MLLVPVGDDVAVVADVESGAGVTIESPPSLDPSRPSVRVTLDGAPVTVVPGARRALVDLARVILSADAVGVARECTEMGAAYSKERIQFGRPIAMYQAVKHHCANMSVATELATSAVWDAARRRPPAATSSPTRQRLPPPSPPPLADLCANLNTQVHGGIAITWEHDAHLYMRRAHDAAALPRRDRCRRGTHRPDPAGHRPREGDRTAAGGRGDPRRGPGVRAEHQGPAGERAAHPSHRDRLRDAALAEAVRACCRRGRAARDRAGVLRRRHHPSRPTGSRRGTSSRSSSTRRTTRSTAGCVRRCDQDVIWCQLFSEPDAGSDAAGVKTKATRVDGGWLRQRPEGVDQRRARGRHGLRHGAHATPTCPSTTASR